MNGTLKFPSGLSRDERRDIKQILALEDIHFVDNPVLHSPNAHFVLFKDSVDMSQAELTWHKYLISDSSYSIKDTKEKVLLTGKEEKTLFLQFNFARKVVFNLVQKAKTRTLRLKEARRLLLWKQIAGKIRNDIAIGNLGLSGSMMAAKNMNRLPDASIYDAQAKIALLRAIDKFDISKGFKFSTYACRAILNEFHRQKTLFFKKNKVEYIPDWGTENDYDFPDSTFTDREAVKYDIEDMKHVIDNNLADLNPDENLVIKSRFYDNLTLDKTGAAVRGLTKERIRQIERKALDKIRDVMEIRLMLD